METILLLALDSPEEVPQPLYQVTLLWLLVQAPALPGGHYGGVSLMLALAKVGISSMGLLAQRMFVWIFPWSHVVPSRPLLSLAAPYHNRSSLRGKGSLEASLWRQRFSSNTRYPPWYRSQSLSSRHMPWKVLEMLSQPNIPLGNPAMGFGELGEWEQATPGALQGLWKGKPVCQRKNKITL